MLPGPPRVARPRRSWTLRRVRFSFLSGCCISFGSVEPLDILALSERANPGMPTSTRQHVEDEEGAARAVALEEAPGTQAQAEQVAAAEQATRDALGLEQAARSGGGRKGA